jgi:hypothetical protein
MKNPKRICYVCGFNFDNDPEKEKQKWPFIFCPCCSFEYGIDDLESDCLINWRKNWIKEGLKFGYEITPEKYPWTLNTVLAQLENLKLVDISNYPRGKELNPNYTKEVNSEEVKMAWNKYRSSLQ